MSAVGVFPAPAFEGSEKRLELDWVPLGRPVPIAARGLRALTVQQITDLLDSTGCCVVSSRSCATFDAYVLSESSLFVYDCKFVIKTCGTTRTLALVPQLLQFASKLGLAPSRCKYSRAAFLFPEAQVQCFSVVISMPWCCASLHKARAFNILVDLDVMHACIFPILPSVPNVYCDLKTCPGCQQPL